MAFGTPVAGAVAYSASAGTSVAPAYPAGILATDQLVLILGQKPSTANGGTATTPTGWTLREELTGAGGYGTTLGADVGNTNLRFYTKNTVTGAETGTLSVTLGTNGVSWAFIVRVPTDGGAISYGVGDGQDTSAGSVSVTLAANPGLTAGDFAIWAMCIPTDVTTPTQFSAHAISATGATFATPTEINEPDSTTGNDIGGFSAWTTVSSGTASVAPTITATAGGTTTNVRGPVALLRMREAQALLLEADPGDFTLTGADSELTHVRKLLLEADPTSFSIAGQDADLSYTPAAQAFELDAQPGSFVLTGQAAILSFSRKLIAQPGTLSHTGQSAVLRRTYVEIAQSGSLTTTGQSATLTYVPAAAVLNASPGAFVLAGPSAALIRTHVLHAQSAAYAPDPWVDTDWVDPDYSNGEAATLAYGRHLIANSASFVLTGRSAEMRVTGLTWPDPADVRAGVQYGPTGIEYTGTLVAGVKIDVNSGRLIKPVGARGGIFI